MRASSSWPNQGARELGYADAGAMWRSTYDMSPEGLRRRDRAPVAAGQAALSIAAHLRARGSWQQSTARRVPRRRPDTRAPAGQYVGQDWDEHLPARGAARGRRRATTSPRLLKAEKPAPRHRAQGPSGFSFRWASRRCPRPSGSARCSTGPRDRDVVCHASAWDIDYRDRRARSRCASRPTAEDFTHRPPRAGPQFLPPRVPQPVAALPQRRERRLPRGHRRHDRAVGDARIPQADRA